ncbi:hypothetical protein D3C84_1004190 [compost metagenome]
MVRRLSQRAVQLTAEPKLCARSMLGFDRKALIRALVSGDKLTVRTDPVVFVLKL